MDPQTAERRDTYLDPPLEDLFPPETQAGHPAQAQPMLPGVSEPEEPAPQPAGQVPAASVVEETEAIAAPVAEALPADLIEQATQEAPSQTDTHESPLEEVQEFPMGLILAVVNQKGGVGKTTTTINLGAALALEGAKVLLVDFDPQGALSVGLGFNPNDLELTVYNLLLDRAISFQDVVAQSKVEGLHLLPSNIDLSAAEILLVSEVAREQMLKRALAEAQKEYNYILIDCAPSLGLLTVNALAAASGVIIPLECEYFALRGMALLVDTIEKVQERINPQLEIKGIVATMLDSRTVHGREVLSRVNDAFGDKLFKTVIHKTIRFAEAPVVGEPILTYAPSSVGAQEYRDLAKEVMSR